MKNKASGSPKGSPQLSHDSLSLPSFAEKLFTTLNHVLFFYIPKKRLRISRNGPFP